MNDLLRSFGRALSSVFHPVMLFLTFVPFAVAAVAWGALLYVFWQPLLDTTRLWLDTWSFTSTLYHLFDWLGFASLRAVVAPFVVISMAIPLIVVTVLLLIVTMSMPRVIRHLSNRQFASLEMRRGGSWYGSLWYSLWTTLLCIALLVITLPLWLVPPFFALIPPLLWGWLTYRVMTYDALALHASADERRALVRRHRLPLLTIGVVSGLFGSLPTMIWASSAWLVLFFPVITAVTIWIYAFILVFTALWFGNYCLRALQRMRAQEPHSVATLS
ncbi:EI24 domain-containing protein [Paraburkholderia caballeronis]|uniref:Etoposide-induced protein 2.4 (EI24) n=1 Tax=Paraburkholderia caballeronis TaxID=416943 RepID=A0A1H7MZZ4_9BURK|nr:EI24 domain-containing protein [Paraburkholderia caballeronis]PXW26328.1 etoposide-induced protein 2.4 (EI24) [Paraburkholderia caballeronis]PXX01875.1 etoposide-induced protein 2.4 (EI24) [Paraburkholderia caballeronis]RAK01032.1 etoposide-induced protein 2.4 (EI24) [Paraburkholderia caballeronis]TDV20740.1 etoposide-induced protein 2.4 (EI24) [Paraburkholderia caballeronis]TDV21170.1 etoposide-induced protein 2.4 (EI24) [Paraburkholderia caballeronis]